MDSKQIAVRPVGGIRTFVCFSIKSQQQKRAI